MSDIVDVNRKESYVKLLRSGASTQEEAQKVFEQRYKEIAIVEGQLTQEKAQEVLAQLYATTKHMQIPFGKMVSDIMQAEGITKMWHGVERFDYAKASELTKLSKDTFRTSIHRPECVVAMPVVISISIGFKLSAILTNELLKSAGLAFRNDNLEHIAYIFLLEHCMDLGVDGCNKILEKLGIPKERRLGAYGRGKDGESIEYARRKATPITVPTK